jgi:hypothetical protein
VSAASEAEVPRTLEVGADSCMTLTDLGTLQVGMKCMEHRSMSFLSRIGTLVGARDDARIRAGSRGSAAGAGSSRNRQAASGHTARGAWPGIFTLVSNIDMGTSFRAEEHHCAPRGCRSSEFRDARRQPARAVPTDSTPACRDANVAGLLSLAGVSLPDSHTFSGDEGGSDSRVRCRACSCPSPSPSRLGRAPRTPRRRSLAPCAHATLRPADHGVR